MGALVYRDGPVSIRLTGDLAKQLDAVVRRGLNGVLEVMESECEAVAANARAEWYGPSGVKRRTGESGDIQVVTTVDVGRSEVRVSTGSTDTRMARKPRGTVVPLPVLVHSPGVASLSYKTVTREEYWATPEPLRGPYSLLKLPSTARRAYAGMTFPLVLVSTEGAGTGHGYLMSVLVWRPVKARFAVGAPAIAAIARAIVPGAGR